MSNKNVTIIYSRGQNTPNFNIFQDINLNTAITPEDGTIRPAVDIFGFAIAFLKNHVIGLVSTKTEV